MTTVSDAILKKVDLTHRLNSIYLQQAPIQNALPRGRHFQDRDNLKGILHYITSGRWPPGNPRALSAHSAGRGLQPFQPLAWNRDRPTSEGRHIWILQERRITRTTIKPRHTPYGATSRTAPPIPLAYLSAEEREALQQLEVEKSRQFLARSAAQSQEQHRAGRTSHSHTSPAELTTSWIEPEESIPPSVNTPIRPTPDLHVDPTYAQASYKWTNWENDTEAARSYDVQREDN